MRSEVRADGNENADYYLRQQARKNYYIGQTPPMNIFSPIAWKQFFDTWKEVMGNTIGTRTEKIAFRKGVLYVKVNSAPLKSELNMQKQKVMDLMNETMGSDSIKEVVIK